MNDGARNLKSVQYFTKEYLEECKKMTTEEILEFLDNYQKLILDPTEKCQLISMKIEPSLLNAFKIKAKLEGVPYQTKIKELMKAWMSI